LIDSSIREIAAAVGLPWMILAFDDVARFDVAVNSILLVA